MPFRQHFAGLALQIHELMTRSEFKEIWLPLGEPLYRVAYYILESESDAEDAVQDLFLKLWNSRDTLDSVGNPRAYSITLMRNLCIDRIRRARQTSRIEQAEIIADTSDITKNLEQKETLKRAAKVLDCLSPAQREVLKMRVFEDLSYDEMSSRTGMNNLTLRVLLSQARTKIKKSLYENN